jgi:hypothetical protein
MEFAGLWHPKLMLCKYFLGNVVASGSVANLIGFMKRSQTPDTTLSQTSPGNIV